MKHLIIGSFIILILACTRSADKFAPVVEVNELSRNIQAANVKRKSPDFNKILREAIYFSSSLEREALKLILNNNSMSKLSLFSVLSYIVEINAGVKKTTPYGLDCGKFDVIRELKTIKIFKSCVKPAVEIVKIHLIEEDSLYAVEFLIKEWAEVVGLPVVLTGANIRCQLKIKDKSLHHLSCENWSYQIGENRISSEVVIAKDFIFQRDGQKQFVIRGGFFKELVENKKIDIVVPLEGKIKIIEKEIKVIDDFADKIENKTDKINTESGVQNGEEKSSEKSNQESSKKNSQEDFKKTSDQKNNQEANQETNQESHQENYTEVSQDVTPAINSEGSLRGRSGR